MNKSSNSGHVLADASNRRSYILPAAAFLCVLIFSGSALVTLNSKEKITWLSRNSALNTQSNSDFNESDSEPTKSMSSSQVLDAKFSQPNPCERQCRPSGSESLPRGIIRRASNLEMVSLSGSPNGKGNSNSSKSLLAIPVGIKQKEVVNQIVKKFVSSNFTVILFHYDGVVEEWNDLEWSRGAVHISAVNQSKWWFAKRFLHPDIVADYNYIFLWDEDLEVENFHPDRYLEIVEREGLHISQPALDPQKSQIHHIITARWRRGDVHRRIYKLKGGRRCYANSTNPPCTGWVEMMAPVFSRAAWLCTWHMIQNDFIYAWGLDMKFGHCAQGDRTKNIGVVDGEYIVHKGLPTLGGIHEPNVPPGSPSADTRLGVRLRSYQELEMFKRRWQDAAAEDTCWTDPYPETAPANSNR